MKAGFLQKEGKHCIQFQCFYGSLNANPWTAIGESLPFTLFSFSFFFSPPEVVLKSFKVLGRCQSDDRNVGVTELMSERMFWVEEGCALWELPIHGKSVLFFVGHAARAYFSP